MLERKITQYLKEWKNKKDKLPLIIFGARQIGKTTSIREFGKKNYKSYIEINFYESPEYIKVFKTFKVDNIIEEISNINPTLKFIPGDTLIFFDEIQAFMDATTSLKFFALDKRFDVICSGSALGINNFHISSVSVGYKEEYIMRPLDFEEFLYAFNYDKMFIDNLKEHLFKLEPLSQLLLDTLNGLFDKYIMIGGLPKAVDSFVKTLNYNETYKYQKKIKKDYIDDIKQYVTGLDKVKVQRIFESIPNQLSKENHKFQFTKLSHGARFNDYYGCFEWLLDAKLIYIVKNLNVIELPLKLNSLDNNFRVYLFDSSLLISSLDDEANYSLRSKDDFYIYKGALMENVIIDALYKEGFNSVYFYRSEDSTIELDFVINFKNKIIPIEVKAKSGRTRSLNTALEKFNNIDLAIKFSKDNISKQGKIINIPYSLSFLLKDFLSSYIK